MPRAFFQFLRASASCLLCAHWLIAAEPAVGSPSTSAPRFTGSPPLRLCLTDEQGASSINFQVVVHPATGFVYAANAAGVLEFDGVRWRVIPMPRRGNARTVQVAADGRVWAAGSGQVAVLEPGHDPAPGAGDAKPLSPLPSDRGELVARDVGRRLPARILAAAQLAPPVASAAGDEGEAPASGLATLVGVTPTLLAAPDGMYLRLRQHIVRFGPGDLVEARDVPETMNPLWWSDGAVHVVLRGSGVHRLEAGRLQRVPIAGEPRVLATVRRAEGDWIWLTDTGPWRVRGTEVHSLATAEAAKVLANDRVYGALPLPDGGFAYGTAGHGAVLLDRDGGIREIIDRARGLPTDRVNGVGLDDEGGLWLAMHTGLARVQRESPLAAHGPAQGLRGSPRRFALAGDRLYVAHSEGLAWRDASTGRFESVPGIPGGVNQVAGRGGTVLATGAGFFVIAPDAPAALGGGDILPRYGLAFSRTEPDAAFVSTDIDLWLARSASAGAGQAWPLAFRFTHVPTGVNEFFDDGHGLVWMASRADGRIRRVDLRGGARPDAPVTTFGPESGLPEMSPADKIRLLPAGNTFFVLSLRGAWRWEPFRRVQGAEPVERGGRFVPEPRMMVDGSGPDASCSTTEGGWLFFSKAEASLRHATIGAGGNVSVADHRVPALRGLVVNTLFAEESRRTLWIAGQGQLISYDLDWRPAPAPLRTVIRRVLTSAGDVLWASAPYAHAAASNEITLAPEERAVRIEFTAPSFQMGAHGRASLRFRSRATGIDHAWTPWSTEAHRDFTHLPDGTVRFEVEAQNAGGRTSEPVKLNFHVLPPWWRAPWAYTLWGALAIGGIAGFVTLRTRSLRHRAAALETIVAERTAELHTRNVELTRLHKLELDEKTTARLAEEKTRLEMLRYQLNPHFLFNTLNSLYALVEDHPAASDMVLRLSEFCRLTLTRSADHQQTLGDELTVLTTYLEIEKVRWGDGLRITVDAESAARTVPIPPFLLLPLVENAIKHGGETSREILQLRLTARLVGATLEIEIANTGRWLAPGTSPARSTHIGLENLRERLRRSYPDAHEFTTAERDGWVVVTLRLGAIEHQKSKIKNA